MTRYHINPRTGNPGICHAKIKCRFGDMETGHFSSKDEARDAYEKSQSGYFGNSENLNKSDDVEIIKVYHGSPERFESFDYSGVGTNGTSEGHGFYFTDSREVASHYTNGAAGYLYEVDFHGKKALAIDKITIDREKFREILKVAHEANGYLDNWGDIEYEGEDVVLNRALEGSYYTGSGANDVDNIGGLINAAEGSAEAVYRLLYEKYGYDHIPAKPDWGTIDQTVYVATVPEAFTIREIKKYEPEPEDNDE